MSTTAACLIASLVVAGGFLVAGFINSSYGVGASHSLLRTAIAAYIVAFVVVVSLAIPFRYAAKRWHFARGWMVVAIGAIVGLLLVSGLHYAQTSIPALADDGHMPFSILYVEFGLIGAAGGAVFWVCCHREMRPNTSLERTHEG
jgi:hypothetical protein